jgi:hypothetical protein
MANGKGRARAVSVRMVAGLALAGGAGTLAAWPHDAGAQTAPPAQGDATLWLAQATGGEGGEGGEGGAPADASAGAALLIELGKLDAHVQAAARLYDAGAVDEATALASHPEAEFMEDLRAKLSVAGLADVTPEIDALVEALLARENVAPAFDGAVAAIHGAERSAAVGARDRYDAILQLARDAASEYGHGVEDGQVVDLVAIEEARGFLNAASALVDAGADGETGQRVTDLIAMAAIAFPGGDSFVADPSILHGTAARIEIAALSVK